MNVDIIGTKLTIMFTKYSAFIVKQLKHVLYDARAVKSNLAKNLTLPNVSLIVTE